MGIKPVKGKIQSQELNDNFSYLEGLAKKDGITPKVFNTLQDLKEKYPNGAEGISVVKEDGDWYYFDEEWKSGGTYIASAESVKKDVIKLTFDGDDTPIINDTSIYTSQLVNVRKYKSMEVFIKNNVEYGNVYVSLSTNLDSNSGNMHVGFYDWEKEEWTSNMAGNAPDSGVLIMRNKHVAVQLGTHPEFYWLKNFKGTFLRLQFRATNEPSGSSANTIEAWLVGEINV